MTPTMHTAHPRTSWEQLGDKWFRRVQHYTEVFDQDLDLDNYIIAGAPYGGAIGAFKQLSWNFWIIQSYIYPR